jgi:hypothetical protein
MPTERWQARIQLKHMLSDQDAESSEQVIERAQRVSQTLKLRHAMLMASKRRLDDDQRDLFDELEMHALDFSQLKAADTSFETQRDFNELLTALYDWADFAGVWIH